MKCNMTNEKIHEILTETIDGKGSVDWFDIKENFRAAGFDGNWLAVRGVMQGAFIDAGTMTRTDNFHLEEYSIQEWYDKDGRPSDNGAYDAGNHYYAERDAR